MAHTVFITGAASGFGALAARQLAKAGHTVWAGLYSHSGDTSVAESRARDWTRDSGKDLRTVPLNLLSQHSVQEATGRVLEETPQLDTIIHNAGHMSWGPAEAFTDAQYLRMYDVNVVGAVRLNAVLLPHFRAQRNGHIIWVSSSSVFGGKSPWLGPYFAAKSAMDSLAQTYARELNPWGIETTILTPGLFAGGTNHFQEAMQPWRREVGQAYKTGPGSGTADQMSEAMLKVVPPEADPAMVADAMIDIVSHPRGKKPYRWFVDPAQDGCEIVTPIVDRLGADLYRRLGIEPLLKVWLPK